MRKLLAALCLAAALAPAQATRTVDQLVAYIKTAIEQKYKDAEVAASVQGIRLSNRLDPDTVTHLGRLGVGPKTVAALKHLSETSASLPAAAAAAPKPEPVLPHPPPAGEEKQIIDEVRENSLNYTWNLPN